MDTSSTFERWEENYTAHGCVKPFRSIIGCPKLLTPDTIENIQELLREDPTLLLDGMACSLTAALHMNL